MFARNLIGAVLVALLSMMAIGCFTADSSNMDESVATTELPLGESTNMVSLKDIKAAFLITKN